MTGRLGPTIISRTKNRQEKNYKSGIRDEAEGKWHKVKGKIKEVAGKLNDDPKLEAEGTNERIAGNVQEKIGQVKMVVGK
ncbi:MAG TPA: CsbD family protein [Desulfobacterales bacterium]|nr:CsbD family protein [Desulfobacterales bacterium]